MTAEPDDPLPRSPFSRIIGISRIGAAPEIHDIAATPAECAAIARQFEIPGIAAISGHYVLQAQGDAAIAATLRLAARVTQTCVISLDNFESAIEERVQLVFVPLDRLNETLEDPDAPDEIPYEGSTIDLGAVLTEQLALSLSPYPRKPGVALPEAVQSAPENPFAAFFQNGQSKTNGPEDS